MNKIFLTSLLCLLFLQSFALCEGPKLSLCNGVWTTKSCVNPEKSLDGIVAREKVVTPAETEKSEAQEEETVDKEKEQTQESSQKHVDDEQRILREKREYMRPLLSRVDEIRNAYHKDFDISKTKLLCESINSTLEECRESVAKDLDEIREYELKLEEHALEQKQVEEGFSQQPSGDLNVVTVQNNTTQVIQNTDIQVGHGPRQREYGRDHRREELPQRKTQAIRTHQVPGPR